VCIPAFRPFRLASSSARGWWSGESDAIGSGFEAWSASLLRLTLPLYVLGPENDQEPDGRGLRIAQTGRVLISEQHAIDAPDMPDSSDPARCAYPLLAWAPALTPDHLGDPAFRTAHGVRFAYIAGEMANGIASVAMVRAMGRAGMLGFFGAAGLAPDDIEAAIVEAQSSLIGLPYGFNLIHSPSEPALESATVDLYLRHKVRRVSASAFLDLTLPLVRYRAAGMSIGRDGAAIAENHVFAKVSRTELARKFLSPPPDVMLAELVRRGDVTETQARIAATLPLSEDLTAEADSGGHTDNRPLVALLPTLLTLRDEIQSRYAFASPPRVGAAGGIGTPYAATAAFAMGAAFVMTGSINQACREAGTSDIVKRMLAEAQQPDVVMAPAADMFEMGVKVQVLKRGTMFALRGKKLYDLYRQYDSLEALPAGTRASLERECFRCTIDEAWRHTCAYFAERDPSQVDRGRSDPRHRMALVFRSYLGQTSSWAQRGDASRQLDFQIWCGPAMGAFNEWARGTFLEDPANRDVVTLAMNLMTGAAVLTRANWLRSQGVVLPQNTERFRPLSKDAILELLEQVA
jgi:PfaD family protein